MEHTQELVPAAHRPLRRVDAHESAFAGELVTDGERVRVRVDADAVPEPLWAFAGADHVAGVRDVARRHDGHDALLPWCTISVDVFLGRRAAQGRALASGEIVTLVGSMLRGVDEIADAAVRGLWWLDEEQRPLFVPGEGVSCAAATIGVVERLRAGGADRAMERLLSGIAEQPEDPRVWARERERWERELTELAAPRALQIEDEPAPARVSTVPLHRALLAETAERSSPRRHAQAARAEGSGASGADAASETLRRRRSRTRSATPSRAAGARSVRDGLRMRVRAVAAAVSGAVASVRARAAAIAHPRRPGQRAAATGRRGAAAPAGRGRMLLIGAGIAAVILTGGLLWPGAEDSVAQERSTGETPTASPTGPESEPESESGAATGPADAKGEGASAGEPATDADAAADEHAGTELAQTAAQLLRTIGECVRNDEVLCAEAVVEGAAETVRARLGDDVDERDATLIEDYGDIAVVRLGAGREHGEQMLVLVKKKDGWLVRDVYDVADQPSERG